MLRRMTMGLVAVGVAAIAQTASADLTVDFDLGVIASTQNLVGDTTGGNNNAQEYAGVPYEYDFPEHVYQFTLTDTYNLSITSAAGGPDHDQILLNSLTTSFNGTWEEVTGAIAFIDENGFLGTFGPGTYYLSIDGYSGFGINEGAYDVDLELDLFVPPPPNCLSTDVLCAEFESGIPAGWNTVDNLGTSAFNWTTTADFDTNPNETGGDGEAATADSDAFNGSPNTAPYDVSLITPDFVIPAEGVLSFDYRHRNLGSNFRAILHTTSGDVDIVALLNAGNPGGSSGDEATLDLSAYAGETATVEFRYDGDSWDWYSQVDNVRVTPEPGTAALLCIGVVALIRRRR